MGRGSALCLSLPVCKAGVDVLPGLDTDVRMEEMRAEALPQLVVQQFTVLAEIIMRLLLTGGTFLLPNSAVISLFLAAAESQLEGWSLTCKPSVNFYEFMQGY